MKDGKFGASEERMLELAARKSGRSLEHAQATWTTLLHHLEAADFVMIGGQAYLHGGVRLYGNMAKVPCIIEVGPLARDRVSVVVFALSHLGVNTAAVMARGHLDAAGFVLDNHVLDFVLGMEEHAN